MLSVAASRASSADSSTFSSAATPSVMIDASREDRLGAWEALVAAKRSSAVQPALAPSATSDCDVLPSTRPATSTAIPRRSPASVSASSFLSSAPLCAPGVTPNDEPIACGLSGLRIRDRRQAASEVERRLSRCRIIYMEALAKWQLDMESKDKDVLLVEWAIFGVVAMKTDIRNSARGEKYVIVTLCDLRGHLTSCFLFSAAFHQHHKEEVGSVICLLNAKLLNNDSPTSHSVTSSHTFVPVSLSVSLPTQLLVVGTSFDFALCASYKREQLMAGGPSSSSLLHCKNIVDLRKGKYCDFHVREEYKRIAGSRPGINKALAGELSGLVRFGDRRMCVDKASGMSGNTKMRHSSLGGGGLSIDRWAANEASSGSVFMMPPLKPSRQSGNTAAVATTGRSPTALKPSTDSARMLAMIQAETKHLRTHVAISSTAAASAAPVHPHSTDTSTRPTPTAPHVRGPPSTPASVAQLRANRKIVVSASASTGHHSRVTRQPPATASNPSIPLPSNPFTAVQRSKPVSREEATKELRRLHALKALAKHGPVAAPDPNSSHADDSHVLRTTATSKRKAEHSGLQVSLTVDGGLDVRHLPPSSAAAEATPPVAQTSPTRDAKRARLEALFGVMDESSTRFQQLVAASSAHVELLADMKADEREQYWQWLETKESMQQQMEAIREQQVEVWMCADCNGRRTVHFPVLCKGRGHQLDKRPATKRFFECGQCRSRVTTIHSALPLHCCHKCGAAQWKASGMISERAGMAPAVRSELQHKSEETWLRSSSAMDGGMRNDDPNNTQGAAHDDSS